MRAVDGLIRREFLKTGIAAGALALTPAPLLTGRVFAAGAAEITVLSDGNLVLPLAFSYPDLSIEQLEPYVAINGVMPDALTPDCNVTLYRDGGRLMLFDVGAGDHFMASAGQLGASLEAAGVDPSDVTDVIFTHAHPDHLWGLVDDFDELAFSQAKFHMNRTEWDFWTDPDTIDLMGDGRKAFAVGAASRLERISEVINLFEPGVEVVPGVEAVASYGHTEGHTSFMIHGGPDPVFIVGDAITHANISFAHPEWPSGSDHDSEAGAATRKVLLDRLTNEKATIIGYHLPNPGEGRVERDGTAYRFVSS